MGSNYAYRDHHWRRDCIARDFRARRPRPMEPLIVLVVLPVLIGVTAKLIFRDARNASFAAALGCPAIIFLCLRLLGPDGTLSWLATLLVSPLAIALSLATILFDVGRARARKRNRRKEALRV